ncbi:MAG: FMN-binding protein [Bacteroidales bacterium]
MNVQQTTHHENHIAGFRPAVLGLFSRGSLQDGTYHGLSRAMYTDEPYYGHVTLSIEDGAIVRVDFFIRDSARQVGFDGTYEKYFEGNDLYMQQCRNDWQGVQSYPDSLLKYQDPGKVDARSGATWSCNIFKGAVEDALAQARGE